MQNETNARLLDQHDLQNRDDLPTWLLPVYSEFRRNVLNPKYPCYFGTAGERGGELRYTWADGPRDPRLPAALEAFTELSRAHPEARHALVVFYPPGAEALSHDAYRTRFWEELQFLHASDPQPWPADQPTDPSDPHWEYCYAGLPLFVFGAAPSYHQRRSRNLGPCLTLLFQPRSVFDGIEGGTKAGDKAREIIRGRLAAWESAPLHPDLGNYGEASNNEWKQYFLPDDDTPVEGPCPFVFRPQAPLPSFQTIQREPGETLASLLDLLPPQGSIELQQDAPGHRHLTHAHERDEILVVLQGELIFEIGDEVWTCLPGTRIELPAGTPHRSIAGDEGALYAIATL